MISPATSGEIFTSVSGCTLPVAETVSMIVRRVAFSVVTGIAGSRLPEMTEPMMRRRISPPMPSPM